MSTTCKMNFKSIMSKSLEHLSFHFCGYVTKAWPRQYCCISPLRSMENSLSSHKKGTACHIPWAWAQKYLYFFSNFFFTRLSCTCSDSVSPSSGLQRQFYVPKELALEKSWVQKGSTTRVHPFQGQSRDHTLSSGTIPCSQNGTANCNANENQPGFPSCLSPGTEIAGYF